MEIGCTYHCYFILNSNISFYKDLFWCLSLKSQGLQCGLMPYLYCSILKTILAIIFYNLNLQFSYFSLMHTCRILKTDRFSTSFRFSLVVYFNLFVAFFNFVFLHFIFLQLILCVLSFECFAREDLPSRPLLFIALFAFLKV